MRWVWATALLVATVGLAAEAVGRTWTSRDGKFQVEATLLDCQNGRVTLQKDDGKKLTVPLDALRDADRAEILKRFPNAAKPAGADTEFRDWTSRDGLFKTRAKLVQIDRGKVQLEKSDGKKLEVPFNQLSDDDRQWLKAELRRRRTVETTPDKPTPTDRDGKDETQEKGPAKDEPKDKDTPDEGEPSRDVEITGELGKQTVPMELVALDPSKDGKKQKQTKISRPMADYLRTLTNPQSFFVQVGGPVNRGRDDLWQQTVNKEPEYVAPAPFFGVAKFGASNVAFALDAVAKNAQGYDRGYFDLNGNGDLTDDSPVVALNVQSKAGYSQSNFPPAELPLRLDGRETTHPFALSIGCRQTDQTALANAWLYSAAVRQGQILQGKKPVRLVLVDHNSNGRFDDRVSIQRAGGKLNVTEGDLLLVNPNPGNRRFAGATMGRDRFFVSSTVCIGKHFYKLDVSPSGDRLSLEPTEMALGSVTNSSPAYRAVVYSDEHGVLVVGGTKGQKVPLPTGKWKVAQYTIDASAFTGGARTAISATFADAKEITVTKEKTTELPLGAPFRAVVTASPDPKKKGVNLSLSILGVGGERCTQFYVNGQKPPEPRFEIRDKDGKAVYQGQFEYG
ncbi:MAG: hypothetical protein JW818_05280 [Pirellulales bacterium]|nr:hypothetical protein [Pirellulales bacterium]